MNISLPDGAKEIINIFWHHGHRAYIVGGCVRDCMMGTSPNDWDIATDALPDQVMACFPGHKIIETGIKHGTITLFAASKPYEVTTFRIDGDYPDHRRPDHVNFTSCVTKDLARRDFTINAIAYHPDEGLVDPYGGAEDIQNKIIRCVGDADRRLGEDALRILRALRFAATLGFAIEQTTANSIHRNKHLLLSISAERIRAELCRLLVGKNAGQVLLAFADVLGVFIPEILPMAGFDQNNPHHYLDVWRHTVQTVVHAPPDVIVRLTMLFHDMGKPPTYTQDEAGIGHFYGHPKVSAEMARAILHRLKCDNETLHTVKTLVLYHDTQIEPQPKTVKRWLGRLGPENLGRLLSVKRADACGQAEQFRLDRFAQIDQIASCMEEILAQQQCFSLKDLQINGRDLLEMGVSQGSVIGEILRQLLDLVMDEQIENTKIALMREAKKLLQSDNAACQNTTPRLDTKT